MNRLDYREPFLINQNPVSVKAVDVPFVDLNGLSYNLEKSLSPNHYLYGNIAKGEQYKQKS
jgi:hypothetical protein